MNMDRFTVKAQEALSAAQEFAFKRNNTEMAPLHLLLALMRQEEGVIGPLLKRVGIALPGLEERLEHRLAELPRLEKGMGEGRPSIELQEVIKRSVSEAERLAFNEGQPLEYVWLRCELVARSRGDVA